MGQPLSIVGTGLVTSVGLSAPAACAAIRAGIANPTETRFLNSAGEWIAGHQVPLEQPCRGRSKLVRMAALAIAECLEPLPRADWQSIPLLLCVAERSRAGRLDGLDTELLAEVQRELDCSFAADSAVVAHGRVSVAVALQRSRELLTGRAAPYALIAATDTLLNWPTLSAYEQQGRLLAPGNSNGFIPGEGGGALLVGRSLEPGRLVCSGLGFGTEPAHIDSGKPLRADGLTAAIRGALHDAGCELHQLDFRITDLSGEQYYFKEAALAVARLQRVRKEQFDIWHPAECIGESGALAGLATVVVAEAACRKDYAHGPHILCHAANDAGQRVAMVLQQVSR